MNTRHTVWRLLRIAFIGWILSVVVVAAAIQRSPLETLSLPINARNAALVFLGIVSLIVFTKEVSNKPRLFSMGLVFFGLAPLVDYFATISSTQLFNDDVYMPFYVYQYVSVGLVNLVSLNIAAGAFCLFAFRTKSPLRVFCMSATISLILTLAFFHPMILNPKYLYGTEDIEDYRLIEKTEQQFVKLNKREPSDMELSLLLFEGSWKEKTKESALARTRQIRPFLEGQNHMLLVFRPLNQIGAIMSLASLTVVIALLILNFKREVIPNPYIGKIVLFLVPYYALEVLHYHAYSTMTQYDAFFDAFSIASSLSLVCVLIIIVLVIRRLNFVLSDVGAFYERKLRDAQDDVVTLWRDGIDNAVIRVFFKSTSILRRFAVWVREQEKPASHTE